jgi:hypothetical protein
MRPSSLLHLTAAASTTAAVLAASPPARAADAVYGGTTRDNDPIVVKVAKNGKLSALGVSWVAGCAGGTGFADSGQLTPATAAPGFQPTDHELLMERNAKGRFAGTRLSTRDMGAVSAGIVTTIDGKLTKKAAHGTLSAKVTIVDTASGNTVDTCTLGKRSWKAARAPGVIYGGSTSQGEPLVLRLNAARRKVDDLIFAWEASCTPDGAFRFNEDFYNWKVKSTGAFGGPVTADVAIDGGGQRHFDYSLGGRVGSSKAKGTIHAKFNDVDAAGTQGRMCDTGNVTWSAQTG